MIKENKAIRKGICLTAVMLLLGSSSAFADTSYADTADKTTQLKPAINLSLKEAVKIMQTTGTRAETAKLNKKSDEAVALGYDETVQRINKSLDKLDLADKYKPESEAIALSIAAQEAGATSTNKNIMKLRRDFAKEQVEPNFKSEMNQIEYDTIKVYYGVLLAQDNLKTEQNNLKTQQDILKNTKAQYQAGMLAKKDVLSAQSSLTAAQSSVSTAQTKLEYARMSFNYLLGYPVMQEIILTDALDTVTAPAINLEDSVKSALANRNEIKGANFAVMVYGILLEDVKAYPKSSATYLKRQIDLFNAQKTAKDASAQIEIDIRNKAAELEDKKTALDAAQAMQVYAQEGFRLIQISYNAGMTTLAELQQAQVNVYKSGLAVSSAKTDYDLAVYAFRYAQEVGVQRLPL